MRKPSKPSGSLSRLACASALIVLAIPLAGCGDKVFISTPPAACASLIPQEWRQGVSGEPIPDVTGFSDLDAAKAYAGAFIGESGQREKANERTASAIAIFQACEDLVNRSRAVK